MLQGSFPSQTGGFVKLDASVIYLDYVHTRSIYICFCFQPHIYTPVFMCLSLEYFLCFMLLCSDGIYNLPTLITNRTAAGHNLQNTIFKKLHFWVKSRTKSLVRRYQAKFSKTQHLKVCHIWLKNLKKKLMFSYIFVFT